MRVRHRHVIYVQGYDPRGLAEYYRMFRGEYRRTCALYGLEGHITRPAEIPGRFAVTWNFTTGGDGWQVETAYDFLRWEDIIRRDFARPAWWKLAHMIGIMLRTLADGSFVRVARAHWRFGAFMIYPFVLMVGFALIAALIGAVALDAASALGATAPLPQLLALAIAAGVFVLALWIGEPRTYLLYLCDDIIATYRFGHRRLPDWEQRFEAFAAHVVEVARTSKAEEIVIVGHSSGSFVAVDVLGRALALDPQLGRHGPRVALLTIGANLPIIGFNRKAQWFRDRMARLATEPSIAWVDYQSRHDIMNFWPFDPIAGHGIELAGERHNPTVVAVSFRDLWAPEGFGRRRWRFFRAHFQFLMANERPGAAYDYYMICCGPFDLATRATSPGEAIAATRAATAPAGPNPPANPPG